jgi:hypothetical protein
MANGNGYAATAQSFSGDEKCFSVPIPVYPSGDKFFPSISPWKKFLLHPLRTSLGVTKPDEIVEALAPPYPILNKKGILVPLIISGFWTPKLTLMEEFSIGNRRSGLIAISTCILQKTMTEAIYQKP